MKARILLVFLGLLFLGISASASSGVTGLVCEKHNGRTQFIPNPPQFLWDNLEKRLEKHEVFVKFDGEKIPLQCDCHGCFWMPNGYNSKCHNTAVIPTYSCGVPVTPIGIIK